MNDAVSVIRGEPQAQGISKDFVAWLAETDTSRCAIKQFGKAQEIAYLFAACVDERMA